MKYVHEQFVDDDDLASAEGQGFTINVQFCRECPMFELYGLQPDLPLRHGWCRRLSDEDLPHYIRVTTNSFCNGDEVIEVL